jgi:hypothetical protein
MPALRGAYVGIQQESLGVRDHAAHIELVDIIARAAFLVDQKAGRQLQAVHESRGAREGLDPLQQLAAVGNGGERGARVVILATRPGQEFRIVPVLHPAVGISDLRAEVVVRDRPHRRHRRGRDLGGRRQPRKKSTEKPARQATHAHSPSSCHPRHIMA